MAKSHRRRETSTMRLLAFLGRYGHQQAEHLLDWTMNDLKAFAEEIGTLMKEEAAKMRESNAGGGG